MSDGSLEEYTDHILKPLKMWTLFINLLCTVVLSWKWEKNLPRKLCVA